MNEQPILQQLDSESEFSLNEDERELLIEECTLLLESDLTPQLRPQIQALEDAVKSGRLQEREQSTLEAQLEMALESGRLRQIYGPHAELAAGRLYFRLPRGRLLRSSVASANDALKALNGRPLQELSFHARGPGSMTLSAAAGGRKVTIGVRRSGLSVESVEAVV